MGRIRLIALLVTSFLLTGCLLRGGSATLADLEVAYNEAQDAITQAESLGAEEEVPQLLELARNRLEEVRENQLGAPSQDVLREYRYVKTLAQRAVSQTLKNRVDRLTGKLDSLKESSSDTIVRMFPRKTADTTPEASVRLENVPSPIAHWSFDGDTGYEVNDEYGNYPGKRVGTTETGVGVQDDALIVEDGRGWMEVIEGSSFPPRKDFTVSLWFYPSQRAEQSLVNKGRIQSPINPSPFALFLMKTDDIVFGVNTVEGLSQIRSVGYRLQRWHHLVATYDGATMKLYVNGTKVSGLPVEAALTVNDRPIILGANPSGQDVLQGRLDEVKFYDQALEEGAVRKLYKRSS
jgi:hypothetical protein